MNKFNKFFVAVLTMASAVGQTSSALAAGQSWWDNESLTAADRYEDAHPEKVRAAVKSMIKTITKQSIVIGDESLESSLKFLADAWTKKIKATGCKSHEGWFESQITQLYQHETLVKEQEIAAKTDTVSSKPLPNDLCEKKKKLAALKRYIDEHYEAVNEAEQAHNVAPPIRYTITLIVEQIRNKEMKASAAYPQPSPSASAEPSHYASPSPSAQPSPYVSPTPSAEPSPYASPAPSAEPSPYVTPSPSAEPSPYTSPSPTAKPTPYAKPSAKAPAYPKPRSFPKKRSAYNDSTLAPSYSPKKAPYSDKE